MNKQKKQDKQTYLAIGLMSGTSMDGIDACLLKTDGVTSIPFGQSISYDYDDAFSSQIKTVLGQSNRQDINVLDVERAITMKHAEAVQRLLLVNDLNALDVDIIGFHGQTIFHDPDIGITVQIGDGKLLAFETGIDVVYDFRSEDVQNGGQGAPLLPVYHRSLVEQNERLEKPTLFLNIGGISNLTYIDANNDMVAFDCGPGNGMMNDLVQKVKNEPFDKGGHYASQGAVNNDLLASYLNNAHFTQEIPKSLDKNSFDFSVIEQSNIAFEDKMATLSAFCVEAIVKGIELLPSKPSTMIVYGGGAHNIHLIKQLSAKSQIEIINADDAGYSVDYMEAECFAFMAVRHLKGLPNSFPETTAVKKPTVGGVYVEANLKPAIKQAS